jgi:hypothetical protein
MRKTPWFAMVGLGFCCATIMSTGLVGNQGSRPMKEEATKPFQWPLGKRAALSLSFDDARVSQIDTGLALLDKHGVKVTFFVVPRAVERRLEGWKKAVAEGHEIGNHSLTHPCTGNYAAAAMRNNPLEDYSLQMMAQQLDGANAEIQRLLGVKAVDFSYPCGLKFVGRGLDVRSYVPLVAERFLVGRGYLDEAANDPAFCDLAQAMGTSFDNMDFEQMKQLVDKAAQEGRWVISVGHEIGTRGLQRTDSHGLETLCEYAKDPANGIWLGTVKEIATYIQKQREENK